MRFSETGSRSMENLSRQESKEVMYPDSSQRNRPQKNQLATDSDNVRAMKALVARDAKLLEQEVASVGSVVNLSEQLQKTLVAKLATSSSRSLRKCWEELHNIPSQLRSICIFLAADEHDEEVLLQSVRTHDVHAFRRAIHALRRVRDMPRIEKTELSDLQSLYKVLLSLEQEFHQQDPQIESLVKAAVLKISQLIREHPQTSANHSDVDRILLDAKRQEELENALLLDLGIRLEEESTRSSKRFR